MRVNSKALPGLAFLALGVVGLTILIPYGIESPASVQYRALSPSYWPTIVCIAVAIIGVILIGSSVMEGKPEEPVAAATSSRWHVLGPIVVMAVCIALYLVLDIFGFVLANMISMVVLMLVGGERRIWLIAIISILTPLALYIFFTKATGVPIPAGVLEPLLVRI